MRNHSVLVCVQLRGVDDIGTVVLVVLVAVAVPNINKNTKTLLTHRYVHTRVHDLDLYLSVLSSQVSPTRSSSESDCS